MSQLTFSKSLRIFLSALFACILSFAPLFPFTPEAFSVSCSTPSVLTGCTITTNEGVTISAEVPAPSSVTPPTVTTDSPLVTVGETTATLLGTLVDAGDSATTIEGFHYGTTTGYGFTTTATNSLGFGTGQFSANISGLTCNTLYHYQAYATNSASPRGTSTGTDETFTTSACTIVAPPVTPPGSVVLVTSSTVNFSGMAYPNAVVTVLQDGVVLVNTIAGADGSFLATAGGITAGSYIFSVYARDAAGTQSATSSFPFVLNGKSIVGISNILISPTLNTDKALINLSEKMKVSGYGAPNTEIRIGSRQFSQVFTARTGADGAYSYMLDATMFPTGAYTIRATQIVGGRTSPESRPKMFLVGLSNVKPGTKPGIPGECVRSDLNCDGKVDIVDYSIMKYWYRKPNPPTKVDLSDDGKVNLKDFSILASDWTG